MRTLTILALAVILSTASACATKNKPLTIIQLTGCIERDHLLQDEEKTMVEELKEVDTLRENLRSLENQAHTLRAEMGKLKDAGKIDGYNALVRKHNSLLEEHRKKYDQYDAISAAYNAKLEEIAAKRDGFTAQCVSHRFYKMDLMDACEASEHSDTPYCKANQKK